MRTNEIRRVAEDRGVIPFLIKFYTYTHTEIYVKMLISSIGKWYYSAYMFFG